MKLVIALPNSYTRPSTSPTRYPSLPAPHLQPETQKDEAGERDDSDVWTTMSVDGASVHDFLNIGLGANAPKEETAEEDGEGLLISKVASSNSFAVRRRTEPGVPPPGGPEPAGFQRQ
eukprot:440292-Rhodomonas_salina.1